jgi:hypothetical protein
MCDIRTLVFILLKAAWLNGVQAQGGHMHDVCHGNELGGTADAAEQRVGNGPKWLVAVYYSLPGARTEGNDAMGRQTKTFVNRPWLNVCHLKNYMVVIPGLMDLA